METFDTINRALSSNMRQISLSAVCIQTGDTLIPIKGCKVITSLPSVPPSFPINALSGTQMPVFNINNVLVLPLYSLSDEYIPLDPSWTLVVNTSS